jgi:GT2 family glycosyltransferase
MQDCKVTVLMSVYNGEKYLREAVESILNQTFTDFEFLIINDGSTDKSIEILQSYNDPRIKIISNEKNLGLTKSLNKGLNVARGQYIARMDADDISDPYRLEKQVSFLDMHPEIGLLGTQCQTVYSNCLDFELMQKPTNDLQIRWEILFECPFAHPTIMMRKNVLLTNNLKYDETFHVAEDYELWTRLLKYTYGMNLNEPLMLYRVHSTNVSIEHKDKQLENRNIIALRTIQDQFPKFAKTFEDINHLRYLHFGNRKLMPSLAAQRAALIKKYLDMFDAFISHHQGEPDLKVLQRQEAVKIAYLCFYLSFQSESMGIFRRLMLLDSGLPLSFFEYLSKAASLKLKRKFLVKQRFALK